MKISVVAGLLAVPLLLSGCGGSSSSSGERQPTVAPRISVQGLDGHTLMFADIEVDSQVDTLSITSNGTYAFPDPLRHGQPFSVALRVAAPFRCVFEDVDASQRGSTDPSELMQVRCSDRAAEVQQDGLTVSLAPLQDSAGNLIGVAGSPISPLVDVTGQVSFLENGQPWAHQSVSLTAKKGGLELAECTVDQPIGADGSTRTDANGEVCFRVLTREDAGEDVLQFAAAGVTLSHPVLYWHDRVELALELRDANDNPGYGNADNGIPVGQDAQVWARLTVGGQPVVDRMVRYAVLFDIAALSPPVPTGKDKADEDDRTETIGENRAAGRLSSDLTDNLGVSAQVVLSCLDPGADTLTVSFGGTEQTLDYLCK